MSIDNERQPSEAAPTAEGARILLDLVERRGNERQELLRRMDQVVAIARDVIKSETWAGDETLIPNVFGTNFVEIDEGLSIALRGRRGEDAFYLVTQSTEDLYDEWDSLVKFSYNGRVELVDLGEPDLPELNGIESLVRYIEVNNQSDQP